MNIEQLNEVETDLVERFDVPLTNKFTPDVMNSITNNSLSLYSLNPSLTQPNSFNLDLTV